MRQDDSARPDRWSEIDLQGVLSRTDEAIFLLNDRGSLVFANLSLHRLFNIPPGNRVGWRQLETAALLPPRDLPVGIARRVDRPVGEGEDKRWLQLLFVRLSQGDEGRPIGVLGFVREGNAAPGHEADQATDAAAVERLERLRDRQRAKWGFDAAPARGPAATRMLQQIRIAIQTDAPVTFVGEAGTGKLTLARLTHYQRGGVRAGLAVLDCQALPPAVQREFLFGASGPGGSIGFLQAPGAATLIVRHPIGMPIDLQNELTAHFSDPPAGWRLLATERRGLEGAAAEGLLAPQFYYLLSGFVVSVPPLRERREELLDHCTWIFRQASKRTKTPDRSLDPAALAILAEYEWPGNLRQLEQVLEQAALRSGGFVVHADDLPARVKRSSGADTPTAVAKAENAPALDKVLEEVERRLLQLAHARFRGNKSKAADYLQISRARFHRRWEQLNLGPAQADDSQ